MSKGAYATTIPLSRLEFEFLERAARASGSRVLFYEWARVTLIVQAARILDGVEVPPPRSAPKQKAEEA